MEITFKALHADYVLGHVYAPEKLEAVDVYIDGTPVASVTPMAMPNDRFAFYFPFSSRHFRSAFSGVSFAFTDGQGRITESAPVTLPTPSLATPADEAGPVPLLIPFPYPVVKTLRALRPARYGAARWDRETLREAVDDILLMRDKGAHPDAGAVHRYILFLGEMQHRFKEIARYFPVLNKAVTDPNRADSASMLTQPEEMLAIAHHLFVLASYGLSGDVLEFGCYKGFSSACLSHACAALGKELHIFDSFQGLPLSESRAYQQGMFAADFKEVRNNLAAYGRLDVVQFHPGFFTESVGQYEGTPLLLWMDVDLETSARSVMRLMPRLSRVSCVFSNEISAEHFAPDGRVIPHRGIDEVSGAIHDAILGLGRTPTGCFLTGDTGAFWADRHGIPVLPFAHLSRLLGG